MHICYCSRENLLKLYEKHVHKPEHGPKSPVVAEALSSLAYLCFKLGEWDKGQGYLEKAEHELELSSNEGCSPDPSVSYICITVSSYGEYTQSRLIRIAPSFW